MGRGLCWLPVLAVLPTTASLQGRRFRGVPGSLCSAHGSGRDGNVHGARTTQSTGTKSKLCSAASTQNPPHPAPLQAVPAPAMHLCPFCSENGLFPPHHCSPAPLACGGAPFPGDSHRALSVQALKLMMTTALLTPAPSLVSPLFPPARFHKRYQAPSF